MPSGALPVFGEDLTALSEDFVSDPALLLIDGKWLSTEIAYGGEFSSQTDQRNISLRFEYSFRQLYSKKMLKKAGLPKKRSAYHVSPYFLHFILPPPFPLHGFPDTAF